MNGPYDVFITLIDKDGKEMELASSEELGKFMVDIGKKYGFIPDSVQSFTEAYFSCQDLIKKVCATKEMADFILRRKAFLSKMNSLFDL